MHRPGQYLLDSELSWCNLLVTDQVRAYQSWILRIFEYLGIIVVTRRENGTLDSKWISFSSLYCLILFIVRFYFIYIGTVERYHLIKRFEDRTFDENLFLYSLFAFYLFIGLDVFLILESKKVIAYYEKLSIFQARYYYVHGRKINLRMKPIHKYLNLLIPLSAVIGLFISNVFNLRAVYKTIDSSVIRPITENLISCGFIIIDNACLFSIVITNMICLDRVANELLSDIPSAFRNDEVVIMDACEKLWFDFICIVQQFGRALSYSVGYYFALSILTSTFEFYLAVKEEHTVLIMFGISLWLVVMIIIVEVDKVHHKLTYTLKVRLLDLRKKVSYNRRQKINKFFKLMRASSGKISLGGFVTLNKGLASSVLNRITTYILVLIQFKHEDQMSK